MLDSKNCLDVIKLPCSDQFKMSADNLHIRPATRADLPVILSHIMELAEYEKLSHMMVATEATLAEELFGPNSPAETLIGEAGGEPVAFAVTFHNFSTFLGKKGLYLEDLYVRRDARRKGYGKAILLHVARMAVERGCGRFEWMVLDWNEPAIKFDLVDTISHARDYANKWAFTGRLLCRRMVSRGAAAFPGLRMVMSTSQPSRVSSRISRSTDTSRNCPLSSSETSG